MIAIIDSGSTKADWIFTDGKKNTTLSTAGMNPFFNEVDDIKEIIKEGIDKFISVDEVERVYFYGAGCSGIEQIRKIEEAFKGVFKKAQIVVDHDIMGAVLATCGNEAGISCIIGTGSNSVYFDGKKIHPNNYGLGYILADEGAGTYLGKKLVTEYLYGLLPKKLAEDFSATYNLSREEVINYVYNKPLANAWLASLAQFLASHKEDSWVKDTVKKGFEEFVKLFVMNYPGYKGVPVHFVGSIAFHYKDILKEVTKEKKIISGKIIQKPIEDLAAFYIKQIY